LRPAVQPGTGALFDDTALAEKIFAGALVPRTVQFGHGFARVGTDSRAGWTRSRATGAVSRMVKHNNAVKLPVRPVTRLADSGAYTTSNGHAQGARPSRPAAYRGRYASSLLSD